MVESAALSDGWECRAALETGEFPRTGWGHRGYEEQAVDEFVQRADREIAAAHDQINDLRLEVDRLHRYIRRQWAAVAAAESASAAAQGHQGESSRVATPAAQARAVLTQAQEIAERRLAEAHGRLEQSEAEAAARLAHADRAAAERLAEADQLVTLRLREADAAAAQRLDRVDAIADEVLGDARREANRKRTRAQEDARRLLSRARTRYEEIVIRAHQRADEAADLALQDVGATGHESGDPARARAELEVKAAYLRTFAKVSRAALQAALEITSREFDRLLGASAAAEEAVAGGNAPAPASAPLNLPMAGPVTGSVPLLVPRSARRPAVPSHEQAVSPAPVVIPIPGSAGQLEDRVLTLPGDSGTIELSRVSRSG